MGSQPQSNGPAPRGTVLFRLLTQHHLLRDGSWKKVGLGPLVGDEAS